MKKLILAIVGCTGGILGLGSGSPAIAQGDSATTLEEIFVTGRKRQESLVDVPVSISVLSAGDIAEQGITGLQELYDATPGLSYDEFFGDRNSSQPGIRGVKSDEVISTQQKVNTFIDGLPMLGPAASLGFFGVEQVEIYRGPQSAVFGRSTFAGAINYVTADASEEFEVTIQARTSTLESNQIGLAVSGPINDSVGYRLGYVKDTFTGPDEWVATDGIKTGNQDSSTLIAKLNFVFSEAAYGELMFSKLEQYDGNTSAYYLDPADCQGDSGVWLNNMGTRPQLFSGDFSCDLGSDIVRRNHDVYSDFVADYNPAAYGGQDINTYLALTNASGVTYEQLLKIASVVPSVEVDRDRWQGELNFEIGDSLLTFLGMYIDEYDNRWAPHKNDSRAVITSMGALAANQGGRTVRGSPVNIEEKYLEARWASPETERLRYTLSGSYYAYDYRLESYDNWGAIYYGLINGTTGDPIDPGLGNLISKITENMGASFGVQYDLTDRTTLSLEGRYQTDEVCGEDTINDFTACEETASFAPRIAINTAINDDLSVYAQFSQGTNPAGVNIGFADPDLAQGLSIASGAIPVPNLAPDGISVPGNAGVLYSDGSVTAPSTVGYNADSFLAHKEEVLTNFEIGAKGSFLDGRGSFTSALYYMIWEDLLSVRTLDWGDDSAIANGSAYNGWNYEGYWHDIWRSTLNAGDAVLYGLELAASYNISDMWTVGGNLSLSSNTYDEYCSISGPNYYNAATGGSRISQSEILTPQADGVLASCVPVNGNNLTRSPDIKGAFDVTARLPNDIFGMRASVRADVRHEGSQFVDDFNLLSMSAVTTMNLSASLRNDNLTVRLFVNNLTDEDYPMAINGEARYDDGATLGSPAVRTAAWLVTPRRPREIGLNLSYNF